MPVQSEVGIDLSPFVLGGLGLYKDEVTFLQDAVREADLVRYTLLAKIAASGKLVPFSDEAAVNGTAIPYGIYVGEDIPFASLVAGDVVAPSVLVGGACLIDNTKLVIENAKTLATVITVGTTDLRTVEDHLATRGIFSAATVEIDGNV